MTDFMNWVQSNLLKDERNWTSDNIGFFYAHFKGLKYSEFKKSDLFAIASDFRKVSIKVGKKATISGLKLESSMRNDELIIEYQSFKKLNPVQVENLLDNIKEKYKKEIMAFSIIDAILKNHQRDKFRWTMSFIVTIIGLILTATNIYILQKFKSIELLIKLLENMK